MNTPQERRATDAQDVYRVLQEFENDNRHSSSLERRMLAVKCMGWRAIVAQVRNGDLNPELRAECDALRLSEIEEAKATKQRDIDALDREERKIRANAVSN